MLSNGLHLPEVPAINQTPTVSVLPNRTVHFAMLKRRDYVPFTLERR